MPETATIRNPSDIANIIPRVLGFLPEESLVVIGNAAGPTARVDLFEPDELAEAFRPALPHWTNGVVVAYYTESPTLAFMIHSRIDDILPGVEILTAVRIHDGEISAPDRSGVSIPFVEGPTGTALDEREVAPTRNTLNERAAKIDDAASAESMAWEAYVKGHGAAAWAFADRAHELGRDTDSFRDLVQRLTNAVPPPSHAEESASDQPQ